MTCAPGQFSCTDGTCLGATRLCDGTEDCPNAEDEDPGNCRSVAEATTPPPPLEPLTPTTPSLGTGFGGFVLDHGWLRGVADRTYILT